MSPNQTVTYRMLRRTAVVSMLGLLAAGPWTAAGAQCADGTPPPCARTTAAAPPPAFSVAVLPFGTPPDSADAYLADGLADALAVRLTGVTRLVVVSRSEVRRLRDARSVPVREAGRTLGAAYVLTGRAARLSNGLTVTLELVRSASGRSVWSRQFELPRGDLLAFADSAAPPVATAILGPLRPDERERLALRPTRDARAYELYLRTTAAMTTAEPHAVQQAIGDLQRALAIDPSFMPAVGRIAYFYGWASNWALMMPGIPTDSVVPRGLGFANRALSVDSGAVDAWMGLSFLYLMKSPPDYSAAIEAGRRATLLDSTNAMAHLQFGVILRRLGDFGSAEAEYHAALAVDPRLAQAIADLGFIAFTMRRFREAAHWYDSAQATTPSWQTASLAARANAMAGDREAALRQRDVALERVPFAFRAQALAAAAQVDAILGDTATARETFAPIAAGIGDDSLGVREGYEFTLALLAIGERGRALDLLERIRPRGAWLWSYLIMPWFDPLRAEPRFQRVLREATPPGAPRM